MYVAVIGAGAIGTVLAAAACDAGQQVTVCARTPIPTLGLERDGTERTLPVTPLPAPPAIDPGDELLAPANVVWVATKLRDIPSAAPWLARLCRADTLV